jgi:hypothetical protein
MSNRILGRALVGALALGLVGLAGGPAGATPPQVEQGGGQPGGQVPHVAPKQQLNAIQRQIRQKQLQQAKPESAEATAQSDASDPQLQQQLRTD